VTVHLWQADGPRQGARGVSGNERTARRAAADLLRSGQASSAVVEEAVTELGMRTLTDGYYCTGQQWQARLGARGRVRWVPVKAGTVTR
jgi:hypothetical protein